ncbi:MAG: hypothetical protein BWY86_01504 [Candidatus Aminicenantes bacterium ADurb.Bin508]|nr:MAG: hypothetical protein BWY86_01504 [Candidatus Aminicenantes bacterium ADurb.Bin508]
MRQAVCHDCRHLFRPYFECYPIFEEYLCGFSRSPLEVESRDPVSGKYEYKVPQGLEGEFTPEFFYPFCRYLNGEG